MTVPVEIRIRAGQGARDYPVLLGTGLRDRLPELLSRFVPAVGRWVVVSDTHVAPLHGRPVAKALEGAEVGGILLETPAGEAEKTRERWMELTDRLLEEGVGRDGGIVAVGGGVVGDLAGFVAATYMRGIPVVQLPTSLLAMIDASVGGKTAVDTPLGKNLVGAFHPPSMVVVDPSVVETLPREERTQGLVEAVKHGAILDAAYGAAIARDAPALLGGEPGPVLQVVQRSVELKGRVVSEDEREAGLREILNFGHTVGHALEHASGYRLPHGTAVAQGMIWEARLGESLGVTGAGTSEQLLGWVEALGLSPDPGEVSRDAFIRGLALDKKARRGRPRVVLLAKPGKVAPDPSGGWAHEVEEGDILALGPWGDP